MNTDLAGWRARLTPERPALLWRGRWLTYAELDARAEALAARLAAEGVRAGDRVSILALNHLAHVDLLLAAPKLGYAFAPLNHRLAAAEQRVIVDALAPALVLHDRANLAQAEGLARRLLPLERYPEWLAKPSSPVAAPTLGADDTWMILPTGGSTGTPKGAQIPYRQVFGNAANTVLAWGLREDDCAIQATPAFHAALNVLATPLWYAGGRVAWMESFEPGEYLELAAAHGATALFMVPAMFQMLAAHPAFAGADLSCVRFAITGGAACPPPVREAFAARGVRFKQGFGMTECGVNCFAIDTAEAARHPDSVGWPMPALDAVIRDAGGAEVPAGTVGELTLRGPLVFSGYFAAPEATREAIRDGWLWTGDLARRDADGRHFICGRRKEMYISGGENVYPAEVEAALSQCRGVAECAVVGVPHPRWGEAGVAVIVARAGARLDAEQLRLELKPRLAGYKLPAEFLFLDALPRTGTGKVAKAELRQIVSQRPGGSRELHMNRALAGAMLFIAGAAPAQDAVPQFGRYMPLYPGMYFNGGYLQDERDAVFDQQGDERDSAAPSAGGHTAFPEKTLLGTFTWHFPLFESYGLPFVSSRTHLARASVSYTDTRTEGELARFAADPADDASTEADRLENEGSGNGDLVLEFGSYLAGAPAPQWRERRRAPFAVVATSAVSLPFGAYNRDAPVSAGSNTAWLQGRIGLHWQPWTGAFVDLGGAWREYFQNHDAAFGRQAPTQQGDDRFVDLSLAHRVAGGVYLAAFASRRDGQPNLYENPRFAPNPPAPGATTSMAPAPGSYYDGGTSLDVAGASVSWFFTQRWLAALHYARPVAGKSGEFDLAYNEHSPAGCKVGATNCTTMPAGSVHVDGLGPARSYSSDRLLLLLTHNFGLGDTFTCTGCER